MSATAAVIEGRGGERRPREVTLTVVPRARYDAIDLAGRLREAHGDVLAGYRRVLYCSLHTTAGFLDPAVLARLARRRERVDAFIGAYRELFPPGADYRHDRLELRAELSPEQRRVEPRNGDSHLAYIGSGLRNCVSDANRPGEPVYLLELDGLNDGVPRTRRARLLGYDSEELVAQLPFGVPVSRHPVDSVNLADPRLGVLEAVEELARSHGVEQGRVELALEGGERDSAITVNEYETMLMRHDLAEVLRDPVRFMVQRGRSLLRHPGAIPTKSLAYARYDVIQVLKGAIDGFGLSESLLERMLARLMALPAARWLRLKRSVSMLVSSAQAPGGLVRGPYQSPILIQWAAAPGHRRVLLISLRRFR